MTLKRKKREKFGSSGKKQKLEVFINKNVTPVKQSLLNEIPAAKVEESKLKVTAQEEEYDFEHTARNNSDTINFDENQNTNDEKADKLLSQNEGCSVIDDSVVSIESSNTPTSFRDLGVCEELCVACDSLGWKNPTQIQIESLPHTLNGKDVIGLAETGSGKTGAFAIPIIQSLLENLFHKGVFALILSPTRELSVQIAESFLALGATVDLKVCTILGGMDMVSQALELAKKPHVIVATPGRIMDHLENTKGFYISTISYLVMDEADRLLSMDFEEAINKILQAVPKKRNTFLFSATMTDRVSKLQRASLVHPVKICLHGKMSQPQRLGSLNSFKAAQKKILVATEVGSRGLDIPSVEVVINYDVPFGSKDYIHRVGRTARAGRSGMSLTIVTPYDIQPFQQIELATKIKMEPYEGLQESQWRGLHESVEEATITNAPAGCYPNEPSPKSCKIPPAKTDASIPHSQLNNNNNSTDLYSTQTSTNKYQQQPQPQNVPQHPESTNFQNATSTNQNVHPYEQQSGLNTSQYHGQQPPLIMQYQQPYHHDPQNVNAVQFQTIPQYPGIHNPNVQQPHGQLHPQTFLQQPQVPFQQHQQQQQQQQPHQPHQPAQVQIYQQPQPHVQYQQPQPHVQYQHPQVQQYQQPQVQQYQQPQLQQYQQPQLQQYQQPQLQQYQQPQVQQYTQQPLLSYQQQQLQQQPQLYQNHYNNPSQFYQTNPHCQTIPSINQQPNTYQNLPQYPSAVHQPFSNQPISQYQQMPSRSIEQTSEDTKKERTASE